MVWAGFSQAGKLKITFIKSKMNSNGYQQSHLVFNRRWSPPNFRSSYFGCFHSFPKYNQQNVKTIRAKQQVTELFSWTLISKALCRIIKNNIAKLNQVSYFNYWKKLTIFKNLSTNTQVVFKICLQKDLSNKWIAKKY